MSSSPHLALLRSWIEEYSGTKKDAAASDQGKTSFKPMDGEDNNTQKPKPGARASENTEDVNKNVSISVQKEPEPSMTGPGDPNQPELGGIRATATGEMPEVEDSPTQNLKDPGTTAPMKVKGKSSDEVAKGAAELSELGNDLLAAFFVSPNPSAPPAAPAAAAPKEAAAPTNQ